MAQKLFIPITLLMSNVHGLNPKSRIFVFLNEGYTSFNPVFSERRYLTPNLILLSNRKYDYQAENKS